MRELEREPAPPWPTCPYCDGPWRDGRCARCNRPTSLNPAYLHAIELLARDVVAAALDDGTFEVYGEEGEAAKTPLQRAISELARSIQYWHYEGDGCCEGGPTEP